MHGIRLQLANPSVHLCGLSLTSAGQHVWPSIHHYRWWWQYWGHLQRLHWHCLQH